MDLVQHIICFEDWCKKCQHKQVKDEDEPCNECLCYPVRDAYNGPLMFEPKET